MLLIKPRKNRKGFTLIELIVVVAILAILAAIAVPNFMTLQGRATQGVEIANASELAGAINVHNSLAGTASGLTKIADGAVGAATVTALGTLAPTFSTGVAMAKVYARVTVTNGVATVDGTIS